jgi:hypothetical protein
VDVTAWDSTYSQTFGLLARVGNFSTPGSPTTRGYAFAYVNGAVSAGLDNFIAIFRLRNDVQTSGVHGSSGTTAEVHGVTLDPNQQYRFIFMGKGTHMEGRIYQLPNVDTPIAVVSANAAGESPIHTNGQCGILAFNVASAGAGAPNYAGPVDVTFDNYLAASDCPVTSVSDDFNDGNDSANPTWTRLQPLAGFGAPGTYTFPGGNTYRIQAAASPNPSALGPARAASLLSKLYADFYCAVDIVNWNDSLNQAFGILARIGNVGLGTTTGYVFTYQELDHDISISRITSEAGHDLSGTSKSITLYKTNQYRLVFIGVGASFEGRVYQLPDTTTPIITTKGIDSTYASGQAGLLVYDNSSLHNSTADATFDNFLESVSAPQVTLSSSGGNPVVSWPASLDCIWVLETSSAIDPGSVWTEITANQIVFMNGQNVFTGATAMADTGDTFYRLRKL